MTKSRVVGVVLAQTNGKSRHDESLQRTRFAKCATWKIDEPDWLGLVGQHSADTSYHGASFGCRLCGDWAFRSQGGLRLLSTYRNGLDKSILDKRQIISTAVTDVTGRIYSR